VAVAVLVEHGEHGASAAAPIAKNVIEAVLRDDLKKKRDADRAARAAAPKAPPAAVPAPAVRGAL